MLPERPFDRLQECHRNRPASTLCVLLHLGCPSQYDVLPYCLALLAKQLSRSHLQRLGSDLYVGDLGLAQIAEPIRVAWSAGGRSPDEEPVGRVEVTHAGGVQNAGAAARNCDHQNRCALVVTRESTVESAVHPDADLVSDAHQHTFEGHRIASFLTVYCSAETSRITLST